MAYDVGFVTAQLREQVFSPRIDPDNFQAVVDDSALVISQHAGPLSTPEDWLKAELRKEPPSPPKEIIPWYRRKAERFAVLAPHVIDFAVLAQNLSTDDRRKVFSARRQRVATEARWPLRGGW